MAQITYSDLKSRFKCLELRDTLLLHGYWYKVKHSETEGDYFLDCTDNYNDIVFKKFNKGKRDWAKSFGSTCNGDFPEFKSLQELTKFVISIYEEPEFKKGDYVTISEREHPALDYPASFEDDMAKLSGKTFLVVNSCVTELADGYGLSNGDPHWYYLEAPLCGRWTWHSSMLRKATGEEVLFAQGVDTPKLQVKVFEESKNVPEILRGSTDCTLRLPKDLNITPHINL